MKKIYTSIITILILMLMPVFGITGCSKEEPLTPGYQLYFINSDMTGLVPSDYVINSQGIDEAVSEVLDELKKTPEKFQYVAPLSLNVVIKEVGINEDQVSINFGSEYLELDSIEEVLLRASVVKSLTGIDGIKAVTFMVEEEPIVDAQGNIVGAMTQDQFVLNAGKEINAYDEIKLTLYFADSTGEKLKTTAREVVYNTNIPKDRLVVEELIKGNEEFSTINPDTKVISTTITDGICYINLDKAFLTQAYAVTPEVTIYSIVNSLVEINGINKVQILIDGDSSYIFQEVMPLSDVYERNLDIVSN